jgi:hypothetical protein
MQRLGAACCFIIIFLFYFDLLVVVVLSLSFAFLSCRDAECLAGTYTFAKEEDIHTIATLLKRYLREMRDPVLTFKHYCDFIAADGILEWRLRVVRCLLFVCLFVCLFVLCHRACFNFGFCVISFAI